MSTVFSRNKAPWQQIYINTGLNVLATENSDDYGWNTLAGVAGVLDSSIVGKFSYPFGNSIRRLGSNYSGEYLGDSENLRKAYQELEYKYDREIKK